MRSLVSATESASKFAIYLAPIRLGAPRVHTALTAVYLYMQAQPCRLDVNKDINQTCAAEEIS
jgi:hypothetical protein